jgi:hypothetical protein
MSIHAGQGVAVREFPVVKPDEKRGSVDYLLYAGGKAIGVVEAKPADHSLGGVEGQARDYAYGLDPDVPHHHLPLPFHYLSTGVLTRFINGLDPDPRSRNVFTFRRPEELLRLVHVQARPKRVHPLADCLVCYCRMQRSVDGADSDLEPAALSSTAILPRRAQCRSHSVERATMLRCAREWYVNRRVPVPPLAGEGAQWVKGRGRSGQAARLLPEHDPPSRASQGPGLQEEDGADR